ncbi:MAG: hypothetical protein COA74_02485 [Gammaproteobacteria bacterium]|nr:MAG: hypothetical protein COA74_02485 [Gammaproteobacteria bacterium]
MTTDIVSTISTTGQQAAQLRQLPSVKTNHSEEKADNIIRINFQQRQGVAKTDQPSAEPTLAKASSLQSQERVEQTLDELNNSNQVVTRNLEFRIDQNSGRTVITVRDSQSKEVIRQIPSEKLLKISERLKELQNSGDGNSATTGILFTSQT